MKPVTRTDSSVRRNEVTLTDKDNAHIFTSVYDAIKYIKEVCDAAPTTNFNYELYVYAAMVDYETTEHEGRTLTDYKWQVKKTYSVFCFGSRATVHINERHFSMVDAAGEYDVDGTPSIHSDIDKEYWLSPEEHKESMNVHYEMLGSLSSDGEYGE